MVNDIAKGVCLVTIVSGTANCLWVVTMVSIIV
jgi:hypothetical protein